MRSSLLLNRSLSTMRWAESVAVARRLSLRAALAALAAAALAPASALASGTGASGTTGSSGATGTTAPAPLPAVTLSPMPGTPDANPNTQISFLGVPAADIRDITVVGSRSGLHHGKLEAYSTGTGGSFLPRKPFVVGENVKVRAMIVAGAQSERVGTSFEVAAPYVLPVFPPSARVKPTATDVLRFHSAPSLVAPTLSVTVQAADPSLGDIFVAPNSGPGDPGPMIVSPTGQLIWFHPLAYPVRAFDFNVQTYGGQPVLTWWQGRTIELHGQGVDEIYSASYQPIATVRAGNGLYADLHDFRITPQGTAYITAFAPIHWNLSSVHGPSDGLIDDGVVQEIDIKTGLVMWQWNALAHVPLADTETQIPPPTQTSTSSSTGHSTTASQTPTVVDYFHVNSVDPLSDGDLLISGRNTWAFYLINGATGAVAWAVGGKQSSFALGTGANFAWQHDVEMVDDSTPGQYEVSMFDNEDAPPEATQSRALWLDVNTQTKQATVTQSFGYPGHPLLADSQGDVQHLANGDWFVGWGQVGIESEFSPAGNLTFSMTLTGSTCSFRAYRYAWNAQPASAPALVDDPPDAGKILLYASWNGATDVASWTVLAGSTPSSLKPVGNYPTTGFETAIDAPTAGPYVQVEAIGASGQALHASAVVKA